MNCFNVDYKILWLILFSDNVRYIIFSNVDEAHLMCWRIIPTNTLIDVDQGQSTNLFLSALWFIYEI